MLGAADTTMTKVQVQPLENIILMILAKLNIFIYVPVMGAPVGHMATVYTITLFLAAK